MPIHTRIPLLAGAAVAAALAIPGVSQASARTVTVDDFAFSPASLSVRAGTTVTWKFKDSSKHNVTVTRGPARFHSKNIRHGSDNHTLKRRGPYKLICSIHPDMRQTIRVS